MKYFIAIFCGLSILFSSQTHANEAAKLSLSEFEQYCTEFGQFASNIHEQNLTYREVFIKLNEGMQFMRDWIEANAPDRLFDFDEAYAEYSQVWLDGLLDTLHGAQSVASLNEVWFTSEDAKTPAKSFQESLEQTSFLANAFVENSEQYDLDDRKQEALEHLSICLLEFECEHLDDIDSLTAESLVQLPKWQAIQKQGSEILEIFDYAPKN